jgi:hypothetical protein
MSKKSAFWMALFAVMLMATAAEAQWRGMGRVNGKVVDDAGAPIEGVSVKATLSGQGGTEVKTDAKGEYVIAGIARGEWLVVFEKPGHTTYRTKVIVQEMTMLPPVNATLKKSGS